MRRAFSLFALCFFVACGGAEEPAFVPEVCKTNDAPRLTLGTDQSGAFELIDPSLPMSLVRGPQGGCHVPLAFEVTGFEAANVRVHYRIALAENDLEISNLKATVDLTPIDDGTTCEIRDFRAFVLDPFRAKDQRVRIDASVRDLRGEHAWHRVFVELRWPEAPGDTDPSTLCGPAR